MLDQRHKPQVLVLSSQRVDDHKVKLVIVHEEGKDSPFVLKAGDVPVARAVRARHLANWALEQCAFEVDHRYDLKLDE